MLKSRVVALEKRDQDKQEGKEGRLIRLTGLWRAESRAGETYLSGSLSPSSRLLILPNANKRQASDPDYVAYLAPPLEKKAEPKAEQASL